MAEKTSNAAIYGPTAKEPRSSKDAHDYLE
jgi:hypothetical protein